VWRKSTYQGDILSIDFIEWSIRNFIASFVGKNMFGYRTFRPQGRWQGSLRLPSLHASSLLIPLRSTTFIR